MKLNTKTRSAPAFTHEGAKAASLNVKQQLRRSVMSTLLWEQNFYEGGEEIATRIAKLVEKSKTEDVANLAVEAREQYKLRHVPLLLVREMARNKKHRYLVGETLARVIQRPDELGEFLKIYCSDNKEQPLANQVKKGLAKAFIKFDEYALQKYSREADVTLKDCLFLCHAKPVDKKQEKLWKRLINDELKSAETWEQRLSRGEDKKETFTQMIKEGELGALALLRNLRNMIESGVDRKVITSALSSMKVERVLPYRFIAAARYAPQFEPELEGAMFKCLQGVEKLAGHTVLLVDVSGSMDSVVSAKSDLTRIDAACGLAILLREVCETVDVITFSNSHVTVPARRGFALRDSVKNSQPHGGTNLDGALRSVDYGKNADRIIVITDEQAARPVGAPKTKGYMLNVASYQNGVGSGPWNRIDGWSEASVKYIAELEREGKED